MEKANAHAAFSPDSRWLAAGGPCGLGQICDLTAPDPTAEPFVLRGQRTGWVAYDFSPDSRWLATGGEGEAARLWDLRACRLGEAPTLLLGHREQAFPVTFSPDSRWLATGDGDGVLRLWRVRLEELEDLARQTAGRSLTLREQTEYLLAERQGN